MNQDALNTKRKDDLMLKMLREGLISVTGSGVVTNNVTGKEIGFITGGYKRFNMLGETFAVNRLVYLAYVNEDIPLGYVVDHRNNDKLDNNFFNLQAITEGENIKKGIDSSSKEERFKHLKALDPKGANNGMAKFTDEEVLTFRKMWDAYEIKISEIALMKDMYRKDVCKMLNSKTYTNVEYRISRSTSYVRD